MDNEKAKDEYDASKTSWEARMRRDRVTAAQIGVLLLAAVREGGRLVGRMVTYPVRFHRYRRRRGRGSNMTYLADWFAKLSEPVAADVRTILAAVARDLDKRWQLGPGFRQRSYVLADSTGVRKVQSTSGRRRPDMPDDLRQWRDETVLGWYDEDAAEVPGHTATAFLSGSREVQLRALMDNRVIVVIKHRAARDVLRADLYCHTRGFVLRRARLSEDYGRLFKGP